MGSDAQDRRTTPIPKKKKRRPSPQGPPRGRPHARVPVEIEQLRASRSVNTPNQRRISAGLSKGHREDEANAERTYLPKLKRYLDLSKFALQQAAQRNEITPSEYTRRLGELLTAEREVDRVLASGVPGGFGTGLIGNIGSEAIEIAGGTPAGLWSIAQAGAHDIRHPLAGSRFSDEESALQSEVVDPLAQYFEQRYVAPFQKKGVAGGAKEVGQSFYDKPVSGFMDVFAAASVGARAPGMVGRSGEMRPRNLRSQPPGSVGTVVHPPSSPNRLTTYFQYLHDGFVEQYMPGRAQKLVSKHKARQFRSDQDRIRARSYKDVQNLKPDTFHTADNRAMRTALYWEAQLPEGAHGGSGLEAILKDLKSQTPRNNREAKNLKQSIRKVQRALTAKRNPKYQAMLESARRLADEAEGIYIEAGLLDPTTAQLRKNILAERLGIEGSAPMFVHHTARRGRPSDERMGRSRVGPGKTQSAAYLRKENELKLYEQGRLRQDPDAIVDHWAKAQTYDFHNRVKDFFADMGQPIDPDIGPTSPYIVNRQGKTTPKWWKDAIEEADPKAFYESLRDYVSSYVAKVGSPEGRRMLETAEPGDLLQVDEKIVHQFFDRYVGPAGTPSGARGAIEGIDLANGLVKTSLLYANPAYYTANFIGNLVFAGVHQGVFLPFNLYQAGKTFLNDRELGTLVLAETGKGPTLSIASDVTGPHRLTRAALGAERKFAHKASAVTDDWARMSAWHFEARKAGFKTGKQQRELLLSDDPKLAIKRDQIRSNAVEAMVNFDNLGPLDRAIMRRIFFVWPWIKGAARWAYRTPLDRPVRSDIIAHQAQVAGEEQEGALPNLPSWAEEFVQMNPLQRGPVRDVLPLGPVSPTGVAMDLLNKGIGEGGVSINPLVELAVNVYRRENPYGQKTEGAGEAVLEGIKDISPIYRLQKELRNPPSSDVYADQSRFGIIKRRVLRPYPIKVKAEGLASKAMAEKGETKSLRRKLNETIQGARAAWRKRYNTELPQGYVDALKTNWKVKEGEEGLKKSQDIEKLTPAQKAAVRMGVYFELYPTASHEAWIAKYESSLRDPRDYDDDPSGRMTDFVRTLDGRLRKDLVGKLTGLLHDFEDLAAQTN